MISGILVLPPVMIDIVELIIVIAKLEMAVVKSGPSSDTPLSLMNSGMYPQGRPLRPRSHPNFEDDLDKSIYSKASLLSYPV